MNEIPIGYNYVLEMYEVIVAGNKIHFRTLLEAKQWLEKEWVDDRTD